MVKVVQQVCRAPCWQTHGRNKTLILCFSFCGIIATLISYETDDEDVTIAGLETYRNIERTKGAVLIISLLITFTANALLTAAHLGEHFFPRTFITRTGSLVTATWAFRFMEMCNGLVCSALLLGSAINLLFTDDSLKYDCTKKVFCASTTASLFFSFATVVTTLANFVIGLCETLKDDVTLYPDGPGNLSQDVALLKDV